VKLDKRVKENALIGHYFNAEELKKYISKECYFTDDLEDFSDLTNTLKGVLKAVAPEAEECYLVKYELNGQPAGLHYTFCLPAEFVEEKTEKKYRPFADTKEFFIKTNFEVGDLIHIRSKLNNYEYHLLIIGWTDEGLMLGNFSEMTFDELLQKFELWDGEDKFIPFGVAK
jgi:hypothetical protein